uniref:Uncharacterized protein n=1 Tax=Glossina brevipalpis TaxID=37001 RepID=A0A1A9WAH6_9MUSC
MLFVYNNFIKRFHMICRGTYTKNRNKLYLYTPYIGKLKLCSQVATQCAFETNSQNMRGTTLHSEKKFPVCFPCCFCTGGITNRYFFSNGTRGLVILFIYLFYFVINLTFLSGGSSSIIRN